jgi:hypothetical protein
MISEFLCMKQTHPESKDCILGSNDMIFLLQILLF